MVKDTGANVIAASMQLIAGRTAQEYNQRKGRQHSGRIVSRHGHRSRRAAASLSTYIDLNMVRAGVVDDPQKWKESGFSEIQKPPKRYAIIDLQNLIELSGFADVRDYQTAHRQWVEQGLENGLLMRDDRWTASIAVGSLAFIDQVKTSLASKLTIAMSSNTMEVACCGRQRKATRANLPLKMRL